jgi:hypothetical protein
MTNNINYRNMVNVDDATSFDRVFWLVEERGLSLEMLQAELGLDRAKDYCEMRLAELEEKGKLAKASYKKRVELEEKAKYWTFDMAKPFVIGEGREIEYHWFNDSWVENNSYVQYCDLQYMRMQYRQTKKIFEQLIDELEEKLRFEEYVVHGNYGDEEEVEELGFNQIHYDGCRRNGENLLRDIKYSMLIGAMDDDIHVEFIHRVKKGIARREILAAEYHKCMAYLYKFSGFSNKMKEEVQKAKKYDKPIYSPKSDVVESNAYSMSLEDAIDLKRAAEKLCQDHYMTFEDAVASLMNEDSYDSCFFAGEANEQEDVMTELAMALS